MRPEAMRMTDTEQRIVWRPQPRQAVFLSRGEYEVLYGGAAGGGKSDAMLIEALRQVGIPQYKGIIFRKTYKQLGNGVNVGAVWNVLKMHCDRDRRILESTASGRRILNAVDAAPATPDDAVRKLLAR